MLMALFSKYILNLTFYHHVLILKSPSYFAWILCYQPSKWSCCFFFAPISVYYQHNRWSFKNISKNLSLLLKTLQWFLSSLNKNQSSYKVLWDPFFPYIIFLTSCCYFFLNVISLHKMVSLLFLPLLLYSCCLEYMVTSWLTQFPIPIWFCQRRLSLTTL